MIPTIVNLATSCVCCDCGCEFDADELCIYYETHGMPGGIGERFAESPCCGADFITYEDLDLEYAVTHDSVHATVLIGDDELIMLDVLVAPATNAYFVVHYRLEHLDDPAPEIDLIIDCDNELAAAGHVKETY